MPPSRPHHSSGWVAYDARDEKLLGQDPNWLASLAPSSYRQALPVYSDAGRSSSPLHRIRKTLTRKLASLNGSVYPPRRTMLTRPTANDSWLSLPSTDAFRFVSLCILWYSSSALSSNTGKVILNQFRYPVTLTFVQFGFVAVFCLLFMSPLVQFSRLRTPTKAILRDTFPMGCFQVGGHIFSSMAISRIPVSTVHTIKVRIPSTFLCDLSSRQSDTLTSGIIAALHGRSICNVVWCILQRPNLSVVTTSHAWRHAGV